MSRVQPLTNILTPSSSVHDDLDAMNILKVILEEKYQQNMSSKPMLSYLEHPFPLGGNSS